jgi:hypothetical protein
MKTTSIQNLSLFKIYDEITQSSYYGCDQEWYTTKWQRISGCGPTVASNIIYYLNRTYANSEPNNSSTTKNDCLKLMEEMWKYVTPTLKGVSSTKIFFNGLLAYSKLNNLNLKHDFIDIPKKRLLRPKFSRLLSFLNDALCNDSPVAFLNLNNGAVEQLYSWHWVTIVTLEYSEDGSTAFTTILDEGVIKKVNLAQWFQTTTLGGGFVSFKRIQ